MAQVKLGIQGGKSDSVYSFTVRTANDPSTLNRATAFNAATNVLVFDEIKDGNTHDYIITVSARGCQTGYLTVPFQCTDTGACESVRGGNINAPAQVSINQPATLSVTQLAGSTPYTYTWSTSGGVISSTSSANTTVTFSQVGTYTITLVISNCGNSPITLTKTIQAVLETCDKTTALCYFYGMTDQGAYSSVSAASADACLNKDKVHLGSFSAGLTIGSTVFANAQAGSCGKVAPGFYTIRNSSNGCNAVSVADSLNNSIIQVDTTGKIVSLTPFTCNVDYTVVSTTQPICSSNVLTDALITLSDIKNANAYALCEGSTFNCTMNVPTGLINGSSTVINLGAPLAGQSKIYTLRLYMQGDTSKYKDVNLTITSPTNCASKAPTPTVDSATNEPLTGTNPVVYRTRITGTADCIGTINVYVFENGSYINKESIEITNTIWEIYPSIQPIGTSGQQLRVTLTCPNYTVESELSNTTTIG